MNIEKLPHNRFLLWRRMFEHWWKRWKMYEIYELKVPLTARNKILYTHVYLIIFDYNRWNISNIDPKKSKVLVCT